MRLEGRDRKGRYAWEEAVLYKPGFWKKELNVKILAARHAMLEDRVLDSPAKDIEHPLEILLPMLSAIEKNLPDERGRPTGLCADQLRAHWNVTPSEDGKIFHGGDFLNEGHDLVSGSGIRRKKTCPRRTVPVQATQRRCAAFRLWRVAAMENFPSSLGVTFQCARS